MQNWTIYLLIIKKFIFSDISAIGGTANDNFCIYISTLTDWQVLDELPVSERSYELSWKVRK